MRPDPPANVPDYIADGVKRQDTETLRSIAAWASELADWQDRQPTAEELEDDIPDSEEVESVDQEGSGTIVEKKVPCGKECNGCPHGPYRYEVTREGESLNWEYKGKVEP